MPNKSDQKMPEIQDRILSVFVCQQCGNCCKIAGGYVYITLPEMQEMARYFGINEIDFLDRFVRKEDGRLLISSPRHRPACFLNLENRCTIYAVRPSACRTYPDWAYVFRSWEAFLQETDACPGLKSALLAIRNQG